MDHDLKWWKVPKMKIPPDDYVKMLRVITENYLQLKDIILWLQCKSDYPSVGLVDFTKFMKSCELLDNFVQSTRLDQMYLQSINTLMNNQGSMLRYAFLEFIVRAAYCKYKERRPDEETFTSSLQKLINQNLFLDEKVQSHWHMFRCKHIWTLDIDDLLKANIENLQIIFETYTNKKTKNFKYRECIDLFMKYCLVNLTTAKYCFGMSKMTNINEVGYITDMTIDFVEFLEMICRVGWEKFSKKDATSSNVEFVTKVGYIIDDLLPSIGVLEKHIEVQKIVIEVSESESDY